MIYLEKDAVLVYGGFHLVDTRIFRFMENVEGKLVFSKYEDDGGSTERIEWDIPDNPTRAQTFMNIIVNCRNLVVDLTVYGAHA